MFIKELYSIALAWLAAVSVGPEQNTNPELLAARAQLNEKRNI